MVYLVPFFLTLCADDIDLARAEVLETLASYGARTRAELLHATRILAYSLTGLQMLTEAQIVPMSVSQQLRTRASANNLNRLCQKDELALTRRLAGAPPAVVPIVERPRADGPATAVGEEPDCEMPEAEFAAIMEQVHAEIAAHRARAAGWAAPAADALPADAAPVADASLAAMADAASLAAPAVIAFQDAARPVAPPLSDAAAQSATSPLATKPLAAAPVAVPPGAVIPRAAAHGGDARLSNAPARKAGANASERPWGSAMLAALAAEMASAAAEAPAAA